MFSESEVAASNAACQIARVQSEAEEHEMVI